MVGPDIGFGRIRRSGMSMNIGNLKLNEQGIPVGLSFDTKACPL
jgi:hypothetical protein